MRATRPLSFLCSCQRFARFFLVAVASLAADVAPAGPALGATLPPAPASQLPHHSEGGVAPPVVTPDRTTPR